MIDKTKSELTLTSDEYGELLEPFHWTPAKQRAAVLLAQGVTRAETANQIGYGEAQIYRWLDHPEFSAEVDRLTFLTGIATKAARVREVKRLVRSRVDENGILISKRDVLDWLRFLREETEPLEYAAILQGVLSEMGVDNGNG
jgi:hypothetical protein